MIQVIIITRQITLHNSNKMFFIVKCVSGIELTWITFTSENMLTLEVVPKVHSNTCIEHFKYYISVIIFTPLDNDCLRDCAF